MDQVKSVIDQQRPTEPAPSVTGHLAGQQATEAASFDPRLILSTLRHCWFWAAPLGISLGCAAAFSVYASFVPMFEATHMLEANQDYIVFNNVLARSSNLEATEKQIILSDLVLDDVVSQAEIQAAGFVDPVASVAEIRDSLRIRSAGTRTLLRLSYSHSDAAIAALVCNAVADSFLAQRERLDNQRVSDLTSWLTPSIDLWKAEVQGHERRIVELSKVSMGFDPSSAVESMEFDLSTLSKLRSQVQELQIQEAWLETSLRTQTNENTTLGSTKTELLIPDPTSSEIARFVENTPEVARQRSLRA
ncbi:MAG: hypothetical protein ACR2NF_04795, partial [Pirellulales bacterium]